MAQTKATTSPLVKVTEIQGRGRGLVASQSIKPGEVLLRDSPILLYSAIPLRNGDRSNFCSNCFTNLSSSSSSHTVVSCPSCSYHALFCSPNCQSIALSSSHSPWVCQALNSIRYSPPLPPGAQVQLHFLIAVYNLALTSPSNFQLLLSLQGDPPSPIDPQTLAVHFHFTSLSPPCTSLVTLSPEFTAALLAKDKQNAFGLMEPFQGNPDTANVRAYGIYPKASFFNHDCLPNACRFDYVDSGADCTSNTDIIVRAIHEIPQGREVCLSYFPVNWNYADRQKRLSEGYGFSCDCDRCKVEVKWKDDDEDDAMDGDDDDEEMEQGDSEDVDFPHAYFFLRYVCDGDNCYGGTLAPLPSSEGGNVTANVMECNVCGRLRSEEEIEEDAGQDGIMLDD